MRKTIFSTRQVILQCIFILFIGTNSTVYSQTPNVIFKYAEDQKLVKPNDAISKKYTAIDYFSEGIATYRKEYKNKVKIGYVDTSGKEIVIPVKTPKILDRYIDGIAAVMNSSFKWAFLDKRGNNLTGFIYDNQYELNHQERLTQMFKVAEEGDTIVMMRIAIAYYLGSEVFNKNRASNYRFNISQNYEKAFEWFSKCAKRGCSQSYFMLGWMCQHGQGTKEDVVSAKNYYQMSKEPEALIQISKLDNL